MFGRYWTIWTLEISLLWFVGAPFGLAAVAPDGESQFQSHYLAARDAEKDGNLDKAVAEYLSALRLRPDEPIILNNLGLVYHLQGKYREAIKTLQGAVRSNPSLVGARLFLGIDYYRTNQPDKAVTHLRRAVALGPKDKQARLYLGRAYLQLGQIDDALKQVGAASRIAPEDIDVL